jgi:hypothetical protein
MGSFRLAGFAPLVERADMVALPRYRSRDEPRAI